LSTSSDRFIFVPQLLADTAILPNRASLVCVNFSLMRLFIVSFRFTVHQSERLEIRCFSSPTNMSSLVSVGRQLDHDWHSANIL
jgi:hypothetical protein